MVLDGGSHADHQAAAAGAAWPGDHGGGAVSAFSSSAGQGGREEWSRKAMKPLWEAADFVRRVRRQLRFGELSRAPLQLLRLELRGEIAECEWFARPPDPWDADLPAGMAERNQTLQALRDAMRIREFIFEMLSEVRSAKFRVYRQSV